MINRVSKKFFIFGFILAIALCLSGCQSVWYLFLNYVVDTASDRFTFDKSNQNLSIPIFTSHPLESSQQELNRLIIVIHGAGLNAGKSFKTGKGIADALDDSKNHSMVIAPQFLEGVDPDSKGILFWGRTWRSGGDSLSEGLNKGLQSVSSYEVMDRLISLVSQKNPNIRSVIILGHSAGGQFVSRYAILNNIHAQLIKKGVSVNYVSANPSSYLYLDAARYRFDSTGEIVKYSSEELSACDGYNNYKYGPDNLYGYATSVMQQDIRARLKERSILFLLGGKDTERSWGLDKSCAADLQGKNRHQRGLLYKHHLESFAGYIQSSKQYWMTIPGVGHDANAMFTHEEVINKLKSLTHPAK